ncbi:hypothetical protein [Paenibacillus sp. SI8]|uniref:galactose-binding domain-containing protein n=1 Tax=unclassified Paenibacillus TaxID=185978 RepID=UPI0034658AE0
MQWLNKGSFRKKTLVSCTSLLIITALSVVGVSASGNIVPTMTSNTNPLGTAYASSEWATHEAYKAFDHNDSTYWSTSSGVYGELRYSFTSQKKVKSYTLRTSSEPLGNVPNKWTLQGSNNNGSWVILHTEDNYHYPNFTYTFNNVNNSYYDRYRLVFTANNGAYSTSVAEVQFFEE